MDTGLVHYDPAVLRDKRRVRVAAWRRVLGFGTCKVVRVSDAALDAARQYQQRQALDEKKK